MLRHDLVIRNGVVVNGLGDEPLEADIAISGGRITAVGRIDGTGREEIDATRHIVTPGFVDIHTHYDGQATWANRLAPSSNHGVTTVVMGNCGVGFAPCRPDDRDNLIRLMEGVEDIPGVVMAAGIPWEWETFPEFMNFLEGRHYDVDVAAQLPHAPLRVYAMGKRGLDREPATAKDMARMAEIASEAIRAGALGVATSRSLNHRASDGHLLPGVSAAEGELVALGAAIKQSGVGVLQCISDFDEPESEFAMLSRVVEKTGVPLSYSLMQFPHCPDRWRALLDMTENANRDGLKIKAQVFTRPVGVILGFEMNYNFFSLTPTYRSLGALSPKERLEALRSPEIRRRITNEYPPASWEPITMALNNLDNIFLMDDDLDYEPDPAESLGRKARALGLRPADYAYDLLIGESGKNVFYVPAANYAGGSSEVVSTMLNHKDTLLGLGDGGAHVGLICDASSPTYFLKRWIGDGSDGTLTLAKAIRALTHNNAQALNLHDRGVVAAGYRADLNIIDLDRIDLYRPEMVYDLPASGGRLHQRSAGYIATIVHGEVTYRDGVATGSLPGRLVRGAQQAPNAL